MIEGLYGKRKYLGTKRKSREYTRISRQFEEEYKEEARRIKKKNLKEDHKKELLERYTAKLLYRQDNKKFDRKYQGKLERNWKQQRSERTKGRETLEMIQEKNKEEEKENE